jgi:predicted ATP-grasp superfamily ATP-dependent carboligase
VEVLICGASARAAAFSALRAGVTPVCADLFADRDLAAVCAAHPIRSEHYPSRLIELSDSLPSLPWLYTGALENRQDLVDTLSKRHHLMGNRGAVLRAVRDPIRVTEALASEGLPCPRVQLDPQGLPRDGTWLAKPRSSGGGIGIAPLDASAVLVDGAYYQQRIDGLSLSALYVAEAGKAELLGVTRQWIGRPGTPFSYVGSLGPWPVTEAEKDRLGALGNRLAAAFSLLGLFGVDFILRDGWPWPVEINPRYTASVEVLELGAGKPLLSRHLEACSSGAVGRPRWEGEVPPGQRAPVFVGKRILFADRCCRFPALLEGEEPRPKPDLFAIPPIADIPHPGTSFRPGDPVLTLFATGSTPGECRARLDARRREWEDRLRAS